ncbi:redox-sensitive bicupin YhaK (pirin superfamily) [Sphingomonas trueperi]|uniref:pirin family protein n=1 Tax=Sphingomonas trueperi TaxID=53317 RepID=UPI00339692D8
MIPNTATAPGSTQRQILRKSRAPAPVPGFAGPGHTVVEIVTSQRPEETDPFVLLMDDRLDFKPGQPVGDEHPHGGLETVTLVLEGSLEDPAEGSLEEGDLAWMTAGKGVIHNENVRATGRARILQLWIALPRALRQIEPAVELVPRRSLPIACEAGAEVRLYSGRSAGLTSPTRNRVPTTIADTHLQPGAQFGQTLPGGYRGLLYVISGALSAGGMPLEAGEIGWIDSTDANETELTLKAGDQAARVMLYAGQPLREPIVQRGPFVAGSADEIAAFYRAYRMGLFKRMSEVVPAQGAAPASAA